MTYLIVLALLVALGLGLSRSNAFKKWRYKTDTQFPVSPKRSDLYYGYYGCHADQVEETKTHVNLFFESQFDGPIKAVQNILAMSKDTILDVSRQLFVRPGNQGVFTLRAEANENLYGFLSTLRDAGALKYVKYIYPIDEPNNTVADAAVLNAAIQLIRDCAAQFPELSGVKLAGIYAAGKPTLCPEQYDLLGIDDYDMGSHVLVGPEYKALKASLLPHQRTMIVPGGSYGQDPVPFVRFAQMSPEVLAVVPFLWRNPVGDPDIVSLGLTAAYTAAGQSVI